MTTEIVSNKFQWLKHAVVDDVQEIHMDAADVQVDEQTRRCPVSEEDHVHLAETIHKEVDGDNVKVVEGDDEHDYWTYVEYPGRGKSTPHIRPAHAKAVEYKDRKLSELRQKY